MTTFDDVAHIDSASQISFLHVTRSLTSLMVMRVLVNVWNVKYLNACHDMYIRLSPPLSVNRPSISYIGYESHGVIQGCHAVQYNYCRTTTSMQQTKTEGNRSWHLTRRECCVRDFIVVKRGLWYCKSHMETVAKVIFIPSVFAMLQILHLWHRFKNDGLKYLGFSTRSARFNSFKNMSPNFPKHIIQTFSYIGKFC